MNFYGYKIDDYHVISTLYDNNSNSSNLYLFTFHNKFETEELTPDMNGNYYTIEEIDENNFMWNGKNCRLQIE